VDQGRIRIYQMNEANPRREGEAKKLGISDRAFCLKNCCR